MTSGNQGGVTAIILAAGSASRAGVTKQLLPLDGKPLLQHAIDNASAAREVKSSVIVLGHDAEQVEASINPRSAVVVRNNAYSAGQSTSLSAGIRAIPCCSDAVIVLLGDQPGIDCAVIDQVIEGWRKHDALLAIATWQGIRGNPVVIDRALFDEVHELRGDTGARALFRLHEDSIVSVAFDRPMPLDVDTQDDYRALTESQPR